MKKATVCKFCRKSVTNFERHLKKHHANELEVQNYMNLSKGTKEDKIKRRKILALLRYETEFENFNQSEIKDPNKMPCTRCKRLISVSYTKRHSKACSANVVGENENDSSRQIVHSHLQVGNENSIQQQSNQLEFQKQDDTRCNYWPLHNAIEKKEKTDTKNSGNEPVHIQQTKSKEETEKTVMDKQKTCERQQHGGTPRTKKRTTCKFCRERVTNFERHVCKRHTSEREVQTFMAIPKNTLEGRAKRRRILALLRYETELEEFAQDDARDPDKLPCVHCKRLIIARHLRRHFRICCVRPTRPAGGKYVRHRAASQALLARCGTNGDSGRVTNEVLCRMNADEVGFVAKTDALIQQFGEGYLANRKQARVANSCSNKMRECARLLMEVRRRVGDRTLTLMKVLRPTLFDTVIACVKNISGYVEKSNTYRSPSLALHFGNTLTAVCDAAIRLLRGVDDDASKRDDIEQFRLLVRTHWTRLVSASALKDLEDKKWNKPILPLTQELVKFRNVILETARINVARLKDEPANANAIKKLVDCILSLTILFNNRRIEVVQQLEISTYVQYHNVLNLPDYRITESENALTSAYKKVVTTDKGGKPIVIIFPENLQQYVHFFLDIRQRTNIIPQQNPYLFAYPDMTKEWVRGDVILKRFAQSCFLKIPEAFISNRMRKHIATVMRLINLNQYEYLQFIRFMGLADETHQECYDISHDVQQIAKLAKLLSLFDEGKGSEYRGKTLTQIDININMECKAGGEDRRTTNGPPKESAKQQKKKLPAGKRRTCGSPQYDDCQKVTSLISNNVETVQIEHNESNEEVIETKLDDQVSEKQSILINGQKSDELMDGIVENRDFSCSEKLNINYVDEFDWLLYNDFETTEDIESRFVLENENGYTQQNAQEYLQISIHENNDRQFIYSEIPAKKNSINQFDWLLYHDFENTDTNEIPNVSKCETNLAPKYSPVIEQQPIQNLLTGVEENTEKEVTVGKKHKKRAVCKFCGKEVLNFERHMMRHHSTEQEVRDYACQPKDTAEGKAARRRILALMRYEAAFEEFVRSDKHDPNRLPCAHCKRLVAVRYLRKHCKTCPKKPILNGRYVRHRAASKNMMICGMINGADTMTVMSEVFGKMNPDEIGAIARTDPLIRHYGEHFMLVHDRAHLSTVCSNKMRECARLLIEMRRRTGKPKMSFFEMLNPNLFDTLIESVKAISGYSDDNKRYKSPSLAIHLNRTLIGVCDEAIRLLQAKNPTFQCADEEYKTDEIRVIRFLIRSQWTKQVSSLAGKEDKTKPVQLSDDIVKFRNKVLKTAELNATILRNEGTNLTAFKKLVNCTLSLTILYNRKRIEDVQFLEINAYTKDYTAIECVDGAPTNKRLKRVVVCGKEGKQIVILFPENVQQYINLLLDIRRQTNIVPRENPYLFAYPYVVDQWAHGDVVLNGFVESSNLGIPELIKILQHLCD